MKGKFGKMSSNVKFVGTAALMGALLVMANGCGNNETPATTTNTNTIPAASVAVVGNTLVVQPGKTVTAQPAGSNVNAISIPAGVTITPPAGTNYTANTTINVTTFNSLAALPAPKTATYVVDSVAGAVDVTIGGVNGATFTGGQATITVPLTGTPTACNVFVNKNDGNGYINLGPATNNCAGGVATINVSNLCTYAVDPHFTNGTTGSTGGSGSSGF